MSEQSRDKINSAVLLLEEAEYDLSTAIRLATEGGDTKLAEAARKIKGEAGDLAMKTRQQLGHDQG